MLSTIRKKGLDHESIHLYFRFVEWLDTVLTRLAMMSGALIVIVTMVRVLGRYFGSPQGWTTEASIYLAIYMAFLLTGPLIKDDNHLQIEFAFRKLSTSLKHRIRQVELVIINGFGLIIGYFGYIYATTSGVRSTSLELGIEMFWAYLSLPILGLFIIIFATYKLIEISLDPDVLEEDYSRRYGSSESLEDETASDVNSVAGTKPEGEQ